MNQSPQEQIKTEETIRVSKHQNKSRGYRWLILSGSIAAGLALAVVIGLLYLRSQPLPQPDLTQTTTIYDQNHDVLDKQYAGENREIVPLGRIPKVLINATIAIEDRKFYQHHGFDLKRILYALYVDIRARQWVQGASTITQQLAKNLYLTQDKSIERKWLESLYTLQLELNLSKDRILELYLNTIYYGHASYGVETASQIYFGKDVSKLNLAEASLLAGIPKGPKFYSPYLSMTGAKARQKVVLQAMAAQGYITQTEAEHAFQAPLKLVGLTKSVEEASYFLDYVRQSLKEDYGLSDEQIERGGLQITTTLDMDMQRAAEAAVKARMPKGSALQTALVALDPTTGGIKAMVGGKDYTESQYNRALTHRQPGSSFKPVLYLSALENGFTPAKTLTSERTMFTYGVNQEKTYAPKNFADRYFNRPITLREAIAYSDNIYAVKTNMLIGMDKTVEIARRLGIKSPLSPVPSLALGTYPVQPLEMAGVFATLANQGSRVEPHAIVKVTDTQGNVLVDNTKINGKQVIPKQEAYVMTNLLESVFAPGGTAHSVANMIKRPVAGKTGTTDTDAWLSGYTPNLAATVWIGYDQNQPLGPVEEQLSKTIWASFLVKALQDKPAERFTMPKGVVSQYVPNAASRFTDDCSRATLEVFIAGTQPKHGCTPNGAKPTPLSADPSAQNQTWWDQLKAWWQ